MAEVPPGASGPPASGGPTPDAAAKAKTASAQAAALPAGTVGVTAECSAIAAQKKLETEQKLAALAAQGHGPQRHEGDVAEQQLIDRAVLGHDPLTGTTTDGVHGGDHKYGRHATKINSPEAFVEAEEKVKSSTEYKDNLKAAEASGETTIVVSGQSLEDTLGPDYKKKVSGKSRIGSKNHPTGTVDTDFTDGTMKAVYDKDASGNWNLTTMYPNPAGPP